MNKDESGIAHVLMIVLVVVVIAAIGGVGYMVYNRSASNIANTESSDASQQSELNDSSASEQPKAKPQVETNKGGGDGQQDPDPVKGGGDGQQNPEPVKSQQRTISFTKGGGSQQGDYVVVSADLAEAHNGTCSFEFYLNGSLRVGKSAASDGKRCYKKIAVSEFPKSATYSFKLSFVSDDKLVSATQSAYDIEVM